jgi:NitT/TauT family transport system substrate-binding protein
VRIARGRWRLAALSAAIVALAASAQAQSKLALKVGASDRPDQAALYLALYRGYFDKEGLAVELIPAATGADFLVGLGRDQIQATTGSITAALFNALDRGIDIRIVADYAHVGTERDTTAAIVGREALMDSGALRTPADLKGRVLGAGPVPAQLTDLTYQRLLDEGHLTRRDVTIRYLGFPDSLAALATGNIDVAFLIEPLVTEGEQKKIERVFMPLSDIVPGMELSVLQYSTALARNRDAATRFMVAYLEGVRDFYDATWQHKNEDATIALLAEHLSLKDPDLWRVMRRNADLNGQVDAASIKMMAAFFKAQGSIEGPIPDIDHFIDRGFAEDAVKILGKR